MPSENSQTIMQSPARRQVIVVQQRGDYSKKPIRWVLTALLLAGIGGASLYIGLTRDCRFYSSSCGAWATGRIIFGSFVVAASVLCLVAAAVLHKTKRALQVIQSSPAQQPAAALPGYSVTSTTMPAEHPPPYSPPAPPLPPAAHQYPPPAGFEDAPRPTQAYPEQDTQPLLYYP